MGLPHVLQNAVAKLRAWGRSKRTTDASPRSHRSAEAFTITSQECAVPVAFRQREQWQFRKRSNGPSTSNATSPHMQLPRNAAILVSSPDLSRAQRLASSPPIGDARGSHLQASYAASLSACRTQFQGRRSAIPSALRADVPAGGDANDPLRPRLRLNPAAFAVGGDGP